VDTISTTVAEKMLCACEGRSTPNTRDQREGFDGSVEDELATGFDFTARLDGKEAPIAKKRVCCFP
jgi:hypothetical protein